MEIDFMQTINGNNDRDDTPGDLVKQNCVSLKAVRTNSCDSLYQVNQSNVIISSSRCDTHDQCKHKNKLYEDSGQSTMDSVSELCGDSIIDDNVLATNANTTKNDGWGITVSDSFGVDYSKSESGQIVDELGHHIINKAPEHTKSKFVSITLADYLEQLANKSSNALDCKMPIIKSPMKFIPPVSINPVFSSKPSRGNLLDCAKHPSLNYLCLLKRRNFIIDRLVERYEDLMKLLHEELELVGHPTANYLEYLQAHRDIQALATKIHSFDGGNRSDNANSTLHGSQTNIQYVRCETSGYARRYSNLPGLPPMNGLCGNRLQETGFLLSPRAVRKVHVKFSPSVSSLLTTSLSSLVLDSNDSCTSELIKPQPRSNSVIPQIMSSVPKLGHVFEKRLECNRHSEESLANMKPSVSTPSLRNIDEFVQKRFSLKRLPKAFGSKTNDIMNTTATNNNINNSIIDNDSCNHDIIKLLNPHDIQEAISWLEVELNAVHNIRSVNLKYASDNTLNRRSHKAYKLAALQNQETIKNLQNQLDILRNRASELLSTSQSTVQNKHNSEVTTSSHKCNNYNSVSYPIAYGKQTNCHFHRHSQADRRALHFNKSESLQNKTVNTSDIHHSYLNKVNLLGIRKNTTRL